MLDPVSAAAEEMARAAVVAAGLGDGLRDFLQIDRLDYVSRAGWELHRLGDYVSGQTRGLPVVAGGIVTDQAVDVDFRSKVEFVVFPAIADVADVAGRIVRCHRGAEIV